jgi:hypothetical protein
VTQLTTIRTEFGVERASCSCRKCRRNCMYMPGMYLPSDLDKAIPPGADPFAWAEINLLASPGALAEKDGVRFRIPTLVPATKPDGSCMHYKQRGCTIWENSPFGCAFFGCDAVDEDRIGKLGYQQIMLAFADEASLYSRLWNHLWNMGKRQDYIEDIMARKNGR